MDTSSACLACYLLSMTFAVAQPGKETSTITPTATNASLSSFANETHTAAPITPANCTDHVTVISNFTIETTPFTSKTLDNETLTKTTAVTADSRLHISLSTPIIPPQTNSTPLMTTTPDNHTTTSTATTTGATRSTVGYTSTSATTVIINTSSLDDNTTSESVNGPTPALKMKVSERIMTILFSVVIGTLAVALVGFMFHKYKQKFQYFHQTLSNSDDTDAFVVDDDTLVISGGLYDGHPIYDNLPTDSPDPSQVRLEFLH